MKKTFTYMLLATLLSACGEQDSKILKSSNMPRLSDTGLVQGRSVWMGTCKNCHLLGVAGAPAVTDHEAWSQRIAKGKQALYNSALTGVRDNQDEILMPPRGGNPRLSDEQVKKAVDYMVASVQYLNKSSL